MIAGLLQLYLDQFLIFVLVITRMSGLMMTAPIFGTPNIPFQVRAYLTFAMGILIAPLYWGEPIPRPNTVINLAILMGHEAIIGLSLGLAVLILFSGLQLSGLMIGQMSGMQLADLVDPTFNENTPIFGQLLNMVALAVFVAIDGHRQLMNAMLETFRWMPPGEARISTELVQAISEVMSMSFSMAIRAAAPIVISLFVSMLIMGLISRTLPQLNVIAVGFSLNSLILMLTLSISMGAAAWIFQEQTSEVLELIHKALTHN
ncbi:MAG: flagellar biosynthetic protein FliR [Pirellulaceae bacterium]